MRVARIETLRLAAFPQVLWVEVTTACGLTGLGETFFAPGAVEAFIHENAAPALIGEDPRDVDRHAHRLGSVYVGAQDSGAEMRAASALDLALWDILGQSLGAPVWRLLGGKLRGRVPVYNTCAGYAMPGRPSATRCSSATRTGAAPPTSPTRRGPTRTSTRSASAPATSPGACSPRGSGP